MTKINFPPPENTPFVDPNNNIWDWDGEGWIARNPSSGGGALPPGGITGQVLAKASNLDSDANWGIAKINAGRF